MGLSILCLAAFRVLGYNTCTAEMPDPADPQPFIDRWQKAGASERSNAQQFLIELADLSFPFVRWNGAACFGRLKP